MDSRNTSANLPRPLPRFAASPRCSAACRSEPRKKLRASSATSPGSRSPPPSRRSSAYSEPSGASLTLSTVSGPPAAPRLRAVAPGISEALITTAAGLAAAIPAVIAYNLIGNSIREFAARGDDFTLEVLNAIESMQPQACGRSEALMAFTSPNGRTQTALADINITPLVDVVLVLLIIFMVTAPSSAVGDRSQRPQDPHRQGNHGRTRRHHHQ